MQCALSGRRRRNLQVRGSSPSPRLGMTRLSGRPDDRMLLSGERRTDSAGKTLSERQTLNTSRRPQIGDLSVWS